MSETSRTESPAGASTFTLANEGIDVVVHRTLPAGPPKAAVLIAHGMAEHALRYARFASELAARGYAVYAPDQRGHGCTAGADDRLGWAGEDGWNEMLLFEAVLARPAVHVSCFELGIAERRVYQSMYIFKQLFR